MGKKQKSKPDRNGVSLPYRGFWKMTSILVHYGRGNIPENALMVQKSRRMNWIIL